MKEMEMSNKKIRIYVGVDLLKLISAIAVVCIHCTSYKYQIFRTYFVDAFFYSAVIFFFASSGFFLEKILKKNDKQAFYEYIKKLIFTYAFWTIVGLPSMLYNLHMVFPGEYREWGLRLIRSFVLTGSTGVFWFVLAMIFASLVMYWMTSHNCEMFMYLLAICGFLLGVTWEYCGESNIFFSVLNVMFGNSKNFIMQGLPYMCMGYALAKVEKTYPWKYVFLVVLILIAMRIIESQLVAGTGVIQALLGLALLQLAISLKLSKLERYSQTLRELSSAIYFVHYLFILVFDFYLKRPWYIDYSATLVVCVVIYIAVKFINNRYINIAFNIKSNNCLKTLAVAGKE